MNVEKKSTVIAAVFPFWFIKKQMNLVAVANSRRSWFTDFHDKDTFIPGKNIQIL